MKRKVVFAVTNDLSYDQRMIRICGSLATNYDVWLVGRQLESSPPLATAAFHQHRIYCFFRRGFLGYAEYNLRLFLYLLSVKASLYVAIDLDTIIPVYLASRIRRARRVYDAHELFCEMKEIATRPFIYKCWKWIEKTFVPRFAHGYTVNEPISGEFQKLYGLRYNVIMNVPRLVDPVFTADNTLPVNGEKFILYQGAVNEGRCFETLIPAMKSVELPLIICGDGNFMKQARALTEEHQLQDKIIFKGMIEPRELAEITRRAWLGLTLFDKAGLSNYYSLANRFFDYMHAGVPQICVNFPVYRSIVSEFPFAWLIDNTDPDTIAFAINQLRSDDDAYSALQKQCAIARERYNWQKEEKKLLQFYASLFNA